MASKNKLEELLSEDLPRGEVNGNAIKRGGGLRTSVDRKEKPSEPKYDGKLTLYLTQEQKKKIEDLAKQHRKATGDETNRIDIVRMLIDKATIDQLL